MAITNTPWWYALVQASPMPELGERVNIGILLGNGRPAELAFLKELPRLEGVVAPSMRRVMLHILEGTQEQIERGVSLDELRARLGPQLLIGTLHTLLRPADEKLIANLRQTYLASPEDPEEEDVATPERRRTYQAMDRALGGLIPALGPQPLKRVTPQKLYESRVARLFKGRVPSLARALQTSKHDILIDGVAVDREHIEESLHVATVRIDRAFWHYDRAKEQIRRETGRRVVTVGLLLEIDGDSKHPDVRAARDYIREAWNRHSAHVVDAGKQRDLSALRSQIATYVGA